MEDLNFVAIDLETATENRSSICEIGLTIVNNSRITNSRSWLIRPRDNRFSDMNIAIHGITPEMTCDAPAFKEVWEDVRQYLDGNIVIAHNTAFDMYALRDALDIENLQYPNFKFYCSYRAAKYIINNAYSYSLTNLCTILNIPFGIKHRAGSDSDAAARLFIHLIESSNVTSLSEFEDKYEFKCGEFCNNYFRPQRSIHTHSTTHLRKKASEYIGDKTKIDEDNYFFGKSVCFTGKCLYGTRDAMLQKVADIGGHPMTNVNKTTDILVVGQQDYRIVGEDGLSSKQEKAMRLKDAGQDIEIMSEAEFLMMFSS